MGNHSRKKQINLKKMKKQTILWGCAILLIWMSSCKIGQKYSCPELNMPGTFDGVPADTLAFSIESIRWESLYADTVLRDLITMALENNKNIRIAAARIKEMAATKRISFAEQFPVIGANLYAQKEVLNYGGDNPKPDPEYGAKLTLSWEVDLWGNLRWNNEAAIATYIQSVEAQKALELSLVAEIAAAYYELCALDHELKIVQQTLESRREGVRLARLRYEGGLTSETSFRQAQVELARTEPLVPSLERRIKLKENDLSVLLGEYPSDIPRGLALKDQPLPDALPAGLSSDLLERRPDIRRAEQKLREANAKVGVAHTNLFPRLRITGNLGGESEELSDLIKSPVWFLMGDLVTPIFAMEKTKPVSVPPKPGMNRKYTPTRKVYWMLSKR